MKEKQKDILQDPRFDKPLSKEAARAKYDRSSIEDRTGQAVQFENLAEAKIKRAMADGVFDNLPGKGQSIDLHNYYSLPEHLRMELPNAKKFWLSTRRGAAQEGNGAD